MRRNIAPLGGDPARVTIFGESAGGLSVHTQLASPAAAGLLTGAIVESGACALAQFARTGAPGAGWPRFDPAADDMESLVPPAPMVATGFAAFHECGLWDSLRR